MIAIAQALAKPTPPARLLEGEIASFQIRRARHDEIEILSVSGRMGARELRQLVGALRRLIREKRSNVILDLSRLRAMSRSSLARLLMYSRAFCAHGGSLKLAGLPQTLRGLSRLLRLDEGFNWQPDLTAAAKAMVCAHLSNSALFLRAR
jgi:ABC-type transporter Mla MlaB component